MADNFIQKINKLPLDVQDILLVEYGRKIEEEIINNHQINDDELIIEELVNQLFLHELKPARLAIELEKRFQLNSEAAKKVALDILGRRLLAADDYFKGEIAKEIKRLGGRSEDYLNDVRKIKEEIKREKSGQEADEPDVVVPSVKDEYLFNFEFKELPPEQEKSSSIQVFRQGLIYFLDQVSSELAELLDDYNKRLILLIDDDMKFKTNLEQALYENKDILTDKNISVSGQSFEPTIGNWLKDFISVNGSGIFTNVVLSQYLANSPNTRNLSVEEKRILSKLLILYRNLKFFPQTLENLPPEKWGIIPIETVSSQSSGLGRQAAAPAGQENNWDLAPLTELERKALAEEKEKR